MTEEPEVQLELRNSPSALILSRERTGIVARGREDAAKLATKHKQDTPVPTSNSQVRRLAELGNPVAQCVRVPLSELEIVAAGPGDYEERARWYREAADQGDADAQYNLGIMYQYGHGVAQDYAEAVRWYRKAAEQEDAYAQYALGYMHEKGQGLPQDSVWAYLWVSLAASRAVGDDKKQFEAAVGLITKGMTSAQIAEAQRLASAWKLGPQRA